MTCIMAIVVYGILTLTFVYTVCTLILRRKHDTVNTGQRDMGALKYWPCNLHVMHKFWSDDYLKNANSNK
jgi:hypothetical protein